MRDPSTPLLGNSKASLRAGDGRGTKDEKPKTDDGGQRTDKKTPLILSHNNPLILSPSKDELSTMKNKRPIIYLVIAVVVAGIVFLIERPDSLRVSDTSVVEFIPDFDSANVARVEVEQLTDGAELKRDGDNWIVSDIQTPAKKELAEKEGSGLPEPKWHRADRARVNGALGIFSGLEHGILVSKNPEKQNLYQVGVSGLKVRLYDANDKLISAVVIGKNGPDFASNYMRRDSDDNVYLIHRAIMGMFTPRESDWRERKIWSIKPAEIEGIEVSSGKSRWKAAKGEDGQWKDDSPEAKIIPEEKMKEVIGKISEVMASDFADETKADFNNPLVSLKVTYSGGKTATLLVAETHDSKKGKESAENRYYAKLDGGDEIYILSKEEIAFIESIVRPMEVNDE